jgi:hypothetical protein
LILFSSQNFRKRKEISSIAPRAPYYQMAKDPYNLHPSNIHPQEQPRVHNNIRLEVERRVLSSIIEN